MITVMGEALLDIITDPVGNVTEVIGGAELNTARTIGRLGVPVEFLGGISNDERGRRITAVLQADGVRTALSEVTTAPTTTAIATLDESGAATYTFTITNTSVTQITASAALSAISHDSAFLHTGGIGLAIAPLAGAISAVVHASPPQRIVMIDPNTRPAIIESLTDFRTTFTALLTRADIVKVSVEDLNHLFPQMRAIDAATALRNEYGPAVLLTDGSRDLIVLTRQGERSVPAPSVDVVDTVGAGDAFSGGFAAWWEINGLTRDDVHDLDAITAAARAGVVVAGITCTRRGANPPHRVELPQDWSSR